MQNEDVHEQDNEVEQTQSPKQAPAKQPSKASIIKVGAALSLAVVVLLIYNFNSSNTYQDLAADIRENMFSEPDIEGLLLTYRENKDLLELTVNVGGISGELRAYRAEAISFVCGSGLLSDKIKGSNQIDLQLTASGRKHDKYLLVSVTEQTCLAIAPS
jgi:hypothetical protein